MLSTSLLSACRTWSGRKAESPAPQMKLPPSLISRVSMVIPGMPILRYCSGATMREQMAHQFMRSFGPRAGREGGYLKVVTRNGSGYGFSKKSGDTGDLLDRILLLLFVGRICSRHPAWNWSNLRWSAKIELWASIRICTAFRTQKEVSMTLTGKHERDTGPARTSHRILLSHIYVFLPPTAPPSSRRISETLCRTKGPQEASSVRHKIVCKRCRLRSVSWWQGTIRGAINRRATITVQISNQKSGILTANLNGRLYYCLAGEQTETVGRVFPGASGSRTSQLGETQPGGGGGGVVEDTMPLDSWYPSVHSLAQHGVHQSGAVSVVGSLPTGQEGGS